METKDFIEATSDAAKRTRATVIILIVACVLGFVGFLNSFKNGWIHQRVETLAENPKYVLLKLGYIKTIDDEVKPEDKERAKEAVAQFTNHLLKSYVDNAFTVRVPFFGVSFDVNDLTLVGGIGFVVILTILRYTLRSEVVALTATFKYTRGTPSHRVCYDLLAAKQLFSLPRMAGFDGKEIPRRKLMVNVPKFIIFLPGWVYGAIYLNDLLTLNIGESINRPHTLALIAYSTLFFGLICWLSVSCWNRWRWVDTIWDTEWKSIGSTGPNGDKESTPFRSHVLYIPGLAAEDEPPDVDPMAARKQAVIPETTTDGSQG